MTSPDPNFEELKKTWLNRYLRVQSKVDANLRTVLLQAAEDAYSQTFSLASSDKFSASVKSAQLRILIREIGKILNDLFQKELILIKEGQRLSASAAVDAFAETDREFLEAIFANSGDVRAFIEAQRLQAIGGVNNAISRITKSDQPLSSRVYRARSLANRWVANEVNKGILKNDGAKEIATAVRRHIRPNIPGGVSYAAMRLGRTEVNNAFHATSVLLAEDRPWVEGMLWNLSKTHEPDPSGKVEICERYSGQDFAIATVPAKPHPQCRCFVTPQLESYEVFLNHLTAGQYRDWINNAA